LVRQFVELGERTLWTSLRDRRCSAKFDSHD
jgi:hypothetical protein